MRRAPKRRRFGSTSTLMLTSMTDMFTLILMFLLNFVDPNMSTDSSVRLPTAPVTEAAGQALTLTITQEGVLLSGKQLFALEAGAHVPEGIERKGKLLVPLYDALVDAQATLPPVAEGEEAALRVECDKAVPYVVLADALYTAGQAGFGKFRFVVINGT